MKKVVFSVLALLICTSAYGNTQAEIQHLLNYLQRQTLDCVDLSFKK